MRGKVSLSQRIPFGRWRKNQLRFYVAGQMSKPLRRSILLMVFRAIRPLFEISPPLLVHHDGHPGAQINASIRRVNLYQAGGFQTFKEKQGSDIRLRRLEKGFSQSQLAEMLGMQQSTLSKIEMGRVAPRESTLKKIYELLNIST